MCPMSLLQKTKKEEEKCTIESERKEEKVIKWPDSSCSSLMMEDEQKKIPKKNLKCQEEIIFARAQEAKQKKGRNI